MSVKKILIVGGRGLVGSSLIREFSRSSSYEIFHPSSDELDLREQKKVSDYIADIAPDLIINAAAKVGGIVANNLYRGDFILDNLLIQNNLFKSAFDNEVENFLFLGSSCIYPKNCPQPIKEEYLLTDVLEETNEPYAIAKIAGLKVAENLNRQYGVNYFSLMPTNLYGENDNFHPENSHVIPGLIQRMQKCIESKDNTFPIWGTGKPRREFLYVDDLARACRFVIENDKKIPYWMNVGTGEDISILDLAKIISEQMGFNGEFDFDTSKPDGTPRKLLDVSKIFELGWRPEVNLRDGIKKSVEFFRNSNEIRQV